MKLSHRTANVVLPPFDAVTGLGPRRYRCWVSTPFPLSTLSHQSDTQTFRSTSQALYLYEYIITLFDEIRYVWRHKYSFATVLFTINRYIIWVETALQLFMAFGDLRTVDVSYFDVDIRGLIGIDPWFSSSGFLPFMRSKAAVADPVG